MPNYKLSPEAEDDLYRIWMYGISMFGVSQADKYFRAFFEEFRRISENPYRYPSVDLVKKGYRRAVSGVDSIYFTIEDNTVVVMAILGRQDIDAIL